MIIGNSRRGNWFEGPAHHAGPRPPLTRPAQVDLNHEQLDLLTQSCVGDSRSYWLGGPATGKTLLLVEYAARQSQPGIIFVRDAAERQRVNRLLAARAPHFVAHTFGGYVMQSAPQQLRHRVVQSMSPGLAQQYLCTSEAMASMTVRTLQAFFMSSDIHITDRHVCAHDHLFNDSAGAICQTVDGARAIWKSMRDGDYPVTREAILKITGCSQVKIPYAHILVDDAEMLVPVATQLLAVQAHAHIVYAGDPRQYYDSEACGFLDGACTSGVVHALSNSFEMSGQVVGVANGVSRRAGGHARLVSAASTGINGGQAARAVIARWDGSLLQRAAGCGGLGIHWVGGCDAITRLLALYHLYAQRPAECRDPDLAHFSNYSVVKDFAQFTGDIQLLSLISIVDQYHHDTPGLALQIFENAVPSADHPRCVEVYSTVSRAKGLRWDRVTIEDDFDLELPVDPCETAKLYLAVTRAREVVEVPLAMRGWLEGGAQEVRVGHVIDPLGFAPKNVLQ
jgi:hypothetical protein